MEINEIQEERLDFLLSLGFKVRPFDLKDYFVFSSEEKFEKRMEEVKKQYPAADYKKLPNNQSCEGDYLIRLFPKLMDYEDIKHYLYNIKHIIKSHGYWNIVLYIVCWEWDCYPEDVEEMFLYEGLTTMGIDANQSL